MSCCRGRCLPMAWRGGRPCVPCEWCTCSFPGHWPGSTSLWGSSSCPSCDNFVDRSATSRRSDARVLASGGPSMALLARSVCRALTAPSHRGIWTGSLEPSGAPTIVLVFFGAMDEADGKTCMRTAEVDPHKRIPCVAHQRCRSTMIYGIDDDAFEVQLGLLTMHREQIQHFTRGNLLGLDRRGGVKPYSRVWVA